MSIELLCSKLNLEIDNIDVNGFTRTKERFSYRVKNNSVSHYSRNISWVLEMHKPISINGIEIKPLLDNIFNEEE